MAFFSLIYIQWEEAEEKDFQLNLERKAAALSDASRRQFLEEEIQAALEHAGQPRDAGECAGWGGLLALCAPQVHSFSVVCGHGQTLEVYFGTFHVIAQLKGNASSPFWFWSERVGQGGGAVKKQLQS